MADEPLFTQICEASRETDDELRLPFEARQKARQRVTLQSGRKAALKLPRGTVLRGGDVLLASCGLTVKVAAAPEPVSTVRTNDPKLLARAAYHLGNRHVWVQVGDGWLRYLSDRVLDDMLTGLSLVIDAEETAFEPEAGAYSAGSHAHSHAHTHTHAHGH